jgi:hypothetical protein
VARVDASLAGEKLTPAAMMRARAPRPSRGAPPDVLRPTGAAPPRPEGVPLAPPGVRVREPEPTRGLDVLSAMLTGAELPKPGRARRNRG